ncbi:Transcription factor iws1 [Phlyctochytrium planicorne]|nr:Transcription factor iws1 [Phlyctochytrium planicorne]
MAEKPTFESLFGSDDELDNEEIGDISDSDAEEEQAKPAQAEQPAQPVSTLKLPKIPKRQLTDGESIEKKKKKRRKEAPEPKEDDEPKTQENSIADEVTKDVNDALDRIKNKRKKKLDGDDPEVDEIIIKLVEKMKEAAFNDKEFNRNKQPAIAKVTLLPAVVEHLSRKHLFDQYLDNNLLDGMRLWLEPLEDGSLPNLDVQSVMFNTLLKMPIRTEHLRESKIGRVVMFYSKCDRVVPSLQKVVGELLEKWMRPILGRSSNFREKPQAAATVTVEPQLRRIKSVNEEVKSDESSIRARVPQPARMSYEIAPKSEVNWNKNDKSKSADSQYKKLQNRLQMFKRKQT